MTATLQSIIESAFEARNDLSPTRADAAIREAVNAVIAQLDAGTLRVAEKVEASG